MKDEDGLPAGQPAPRPALPDTSKELLRKLAEELLLLHGQAEAAEARAAAAEAHAATLQQRLDEALAAAAAAGGQGGDGAAPEWQELWADAQRRAREAEEAAAAARAEASSLQAELTSSQRQLSAVQQEAAAARQRAEEAEAQLAEARREAEAAQLQAARAAEEAAATQRELGEAQRKLREVQRQLREQGPDPSAPLEAAVQRPQDVLTLRVKLNEERRLRKKAEGELGGERRQQQAAEALARSLQAQAAEQLDDTTHQQQQQQQQQEGLPARPASAEGRQAFAALAPRQAAAVPAGHEHGQQGLHHNQPPAPAAPLPAHAPAAPAPHIDIDLAAVEDDAAGAAQQQQQQLRQRSGGSREQRGQQLGHSSEDDETIREPAGAAAAEPAAAATAEQQQQQQQQPAVGEGAMRPPPQRLGRLRGPMRPAGSTPAAAAAGSAAGSAAVAAAALQRKRRQAEGAAVEEPPAPASAPAPTAASRRPSSGGAMVKRHRSAAEASPCSPGESAMGAVGVLQRQLRRNSSAAAAAAAAGAGAGASAGAAGSLLLRLAAAGDQEEGEEEVSGEGSRGRQGGRRSAAVPSYSDRGVSGGGVVLKAGESAKDWLNRSIAAFMGTLLSRSDFEVFSKPVDTAQVPDYLEVVDQPMDLGTIRAKAAKGRYRSPGEFQSDLKLVVSNAQLYNESKQHPVHQAAARLMETLRKPHSFYSKVGDDFRQAETAATLAEEKARQEAEIEALERQLAEQVHPGLNLAVYAEDDDRGNKYFLLRATKPTLTLTKSEVDDFGNEFTRGDKVVVGHYYDYWPDERVDWDSKKRPYYLQVDRTAYVPASSLLLVDFELHARKEPEVSPYSGQEERIYEVAPSLHAELRRQIKKMTAEPVVSPRSP
ncbi:hypothetical protein ABPG75_000300 [Micractinium tetrahymenae]